MLSAGFLLVRPVARPSYTSAELIPGEVISASDCICPQFPGPYAISWCIATDQERTDGLTAAGIAEELHDSAIEWATSVFDDLYGWPGVFYTVDAAREARARFFAPESVKVIGLGLPDEFASDFIRQATPPISPPGFAPNGESGFLQSVKRGNALPAGGRTLGFEPLNLQFGMFEDSWLCSGSETHCAATLNVRPEANGLLASLDDARRCVSLLDREDAHAEDGPWYPILLVEY